MNLAELGKSLRAGGLTPRALAAWAGSDRLSALSALLPRVASTTPASSLLALFVAGDTLPVSRVTLTDVLDRHELADLQDDTVRARIAVLPAGPALVVCDRLNTSDGLDIVCWPDDSSYHLARALTPGRRDAWLDLGCGSGFAQLLRPELAHTLVAADLNPRAVRYARLGAELSGIPIAVYESDLGDRLPPRHYDLVTCNAPIPYGRDAPSQSRWRSTDASFVARLVRHAEALVAPTGLIVVHAAVDAILPVVTELAGERVVVTYTPADTRAFAIAWWQPSGTNRLVTTHRALSDERPHISHEDRLAALAAA